MSSPPVSFRRLFDSDFLFEEVYEVGRGDHIENVVGKWKLLSVGFTESAVDLA
jgi:hypothetical protein